MIVARRQLTNQEAYSKPTKRLRNGYEVTTKFKTTYSAYSFRFMKSTHRLTRDLIS